MHLRSILAIACLTSILFAAQADAQSTPDPVRVARATGIIHVDGELDEAAWQDATRIDTWYETNPGDNLEPKVKNVGWMTYDEKFFYVALEFFDPDVRAIRAPFADRDNISGGTDYGGVILSTSGDGKTAIEFLANPRGIQYDAITSDTSGEDPAPDFFWESAGRIYEDRWTLEIRIPFSSLRYPESADQNWTAILYRNYPRDRRYQHFSARLPRDVTCFVCSYAPLTGIENLPSSGGLVAAPYATARHDSLPEDGLGSPLESQGSDFDGGLDAKWTPDADTAIDATINPDFSQIESDVAVITTNERFAVFLPEKRPFFLEGKDLFSLPLEAVYTRTIFDPRWGLRGTGRVGDATYTALVVDDEGGGPVIMPGPNNSGLAQADFGSLNLVARGRYDVGRSFGSFLVTDREIDGGGHNRVLGPDFQWRPNQQDTVTVQLLWSDSETPDRPDLAAEWNGQDLSGHGAKAAWSRGTRTYDFEVVYLDVADEFRADLGFIPQVGIREGYFNGGWTFYPKGFFSRVRAYAFADYTGTRDGELVYQEIRPGVSMDGRWNSFMNFSFSSNEVEAGKGPIERNRLFYTLQANPGRVFNRLELTGWVGEEIDFANSRPGDGARIAFNATIRPTDHLELVANTEYRYLDVENGKRLFDAEVERLKATYTFNSRSYLRLIGQHVRTDRDPELYTFPVEEHTGTIDFSALFAYKLNWQTVLFVGYGDQSALTEAEEFEPAARSAFLKISYAFQM
ncbi:MAG: carbohydrate binding family 9 domain-containing protein [Thermoanaerobaculia bacterium]|nr:carbohydrate binding family 9 domain-containing protein [Thermoanaerobaculia bacterium]